ncbi:MAG: 2-amino-4-hydroxy-6-hydroxymethyldihydropteridine diphosphokinase [Planktotalea sp.]|uniref:2-amino-4-hydroxy-6- hydroxymethyldihydropteridine diphosphokinase n=1 Tax=Planktotalea sp. TaxID=2029877 RepID=UPI003C734233
MKNGSLQLVALGANLSLTGCTLEQTLQAAVKSLAQSGFAIRAVSRFFTTPCFPVGAGPDYVNAAVAVQSGQDARQTLKLLHKIEADFGRERNQRWGQRTLDLDLLAMDDLVLPNKQIFEEWFELDPHLQAQAVPDALILPHPRLQDRAFVLAPLADIAPTWVHPVLQKSVAHMLAALPEDEVAQVIPI